MPSEITIRRIGWFMVISGFIGFFGCMPFSVCLGKYFPSTIEPPLGDITAIVSDSKGRIYCASAAYGMVHQYDHSGKFIRAWWIDAGGGDFNIAIDNKDRIQIGTARTELHLTYNTSGLLINTKPCHDTYGKLETPTPLTFKAPNGVIYKAVTPNLYPRIAKITKQGHQTTIIALPIYYWLISGPFQGWLRIIIGIAFLRTAEGFEEERKEKRQRPSRHPE